MGRMIMLCDIISKHHQVATKLKNFIVCYCNNFNTAFWRWQKVEWITIA